MLADLNQCLGLNMDTGHTWASLQQWGLLSLLFPLLICDLYCVRMSIPQLTPSPFWWGDKPLRSHFMVRSRWPSIKLKTVIVLGVLTSDS